VINFEMTGTGLELGKPSKRRKKGFFVDFYGKLLGEVRAPTKKSMESDPRVVSEFHLGAPL